jgi:hypothetical protein
MQRKFETILSTHLKNEETKKNFNQTISETCGRVQNRPFSGAGTEDQEKEPAIY